MKYTIQYICILFLTTTAHIYNSDNLSFKENKLKSLDFPIEINDFTRKDVKIDNFLHFIFLESKKQTFCYAVTRIHEKSTITKLNTDCQNKCWWHFFSPNDFKEIKSNVEFYGLVGPERVCAFANGDIYISRRNTKDNEFSQVLKVEKQNNDIITSCTGLSQNSLWVTIYNKEKKKTSTNNYVFNKEKQKHEKQKEDPNISTIHVAITQDDKFRWFINKDIKKNIYRLNIVPREDNEEISQDSPLENKNNINIDAIHHFTALNDETAFFIDQDGLSIYQLNNEGDTGLLLKHTEPINAIGIWNKNLILAIKNQFYQYEGSFDVIKKEIEPEEINLSTTLFNELKSTPVDTQDELKSTPVNIKDELKSIPVDTQNELKSIPVDTQDELKSTPVNIKDELKSIPVDTQNELKSIPVDIKDELKSIPVDIKDELKSIPVDTQNKQITIKNTEAVDKKNLSDINWVPLNGETPLTTTVYSQYPSKPKDKQSKNTQKDSPREGKVSSNTKKKTPSYFKSLKNFIAGAYYYLSNKKQSTQTSIKTATPKVEKNVQNETYFQTFQYWFNNIKNWWFPPFNQNDTSQ